MRKKLSEKAKALGKHYLIGILISLAFNSLAVWSYPSLLQNVDYINGISRNTYNLSTINWGILFLIFLTIQAPFGGLIYYKFRPV